MAPKKSEGGVIPRPANVDPEWAEKIAQAKKARERAQKQGTEKPFGFYVPRSICRPK
jgi:hypothetical protein